MIRSDRGVRSVIDLNDLLGTADGPCGGAPPLAQLDLVAVRLARPVVSARSVQIGLKLVAPGSPLQRDRRPHHRFDSHRTSLCHRPGWKTAQREANLERLVDELSAEVQRLDEDLELLLSAVAAG